MQFIAKTSKIDSVTIAVNFWYRRLETICVLCNAVADKLLLILCLRVTRCCGLICVACVCLLSFTFVPRERKSLCYTNEKNFEISQTTRRRLLPLEAIVTRAHRSINKTTLFLARPDNKQLLMNLWNRFKLITDGVSDLSATLRAIEGRS